jgi:hypothetical protein
MAVESWITDLLELFEAIGCIDEQKVRYAKLKIIGEASRWWKSKNLLTLELGEEFVIT